MYGPRSRASGVDEPEHCARWPTLCAALLVFASLSIAAAGGAQARPIEYRVRSSAVDPSVTQFDEPHVILYDPQLRARSGLLVFLGGTRSEPANLEPLLTLLAGGGYAVIGLQYNDSPAVVEVCHADPDPNCSAAFRQMRLFGTGGGGGVSNSPAESIVHRLTALLDYLSRHDQGVSWSEFLAGESPDWSRITVAGFSQGAGMAAYIAKQAVVARVVLLSGPWDFTGPPHHMAPWIPTPNATPPDRWFAEYHRHENTAAVIARSYEALQIPADHVLVFDRELPARQLHGPNPYHVSVVFDPRNVPQWRQLFALR